MNSVLKWLLRLSFTKLQTYQAFVSTCIKVVVSPSRLYPRLRSEKVLKTSMGSLKNLMESCQMLDSMIKNPRPTRAETIDVANAVFDGSDCVMLSGETAKGSYRVESVRTMVDICREAEKMLNYSYVFQSLRNHLSTVDLMTVTETITSSAVKTAYDLNAALIICLTETGNTARLICKYRPVSPVICVTLNEATARQLFLRCGAFPMLVSSMIGTESLTALVINRSTTAGFTQGGDFIVLVSGMTRGVSGGANILRVIKNE